MTRHENGVALDFYGLDHNLPRLRRLRLGCRLRLRRRGGDFLSRWLLFGSRFCGCSIALSLIFRQGDRLLLGSGRLGGRRCFFGSGYGWLIRGGRALLGLRRRGRP
jgi:hypothetical protein